MFQLGEPISTSQHWCQQTDEEVETSRSWRLVDEGGLDISPLGTWLTAVGLPSSSFSGSGGTWNEVEFDDWGCGALVDEAGLLRLGISIR
jgi:hypothetical protein